MFLNKVWRDIGSIVRQLKLKNMYQIQSVDKERFEKSFGDFIYNLVWCSDILDGFTKEEVNQYIRKISGNKVVQTEIVNLIGDIIDKNI